MGLDVGFHTQFGEEILSFRDHHGFFRMFLDEEPATFQGCSDFHVSGSLLETALSRIEYEMAFAEPVPAPREEPHPSTASKAFAEGTSDFFDAEPEDWPAALPHYQTALLQLLDHVDEHGDLVCGWSS